jgi:eukaryotic-like serine/threonine-protein kinase
VLAYAHARQVIHRDLKPENIMVRQGMRGWHVKVLDFGIARVADGATRLTAQGAVAGTPRYMSPEQAMGLDVDARADIYAVGALAFLMLTGRKVFESSDDLELTTKILNEEPPRVSQAAPQPVPLELDLIVTACLEKKRELRPQRVADLVEALDALAAEHRWMQREAQEWWNAIPPLKQ